MNKVVIIAIIAVVAVVGILFGTGIINLSLGPAITSGQEATSAAVDISSDLGNIGSILEDLDKKLG